MAARRPVPKAKPKMAIPKRRPKKTVAKKAVPPPAPPPAPQVSQSFIQFNPYGFSDAHVLKGIQYAHDVVAGKIDACKYVKQACQRQLRDLERALGGKRDEVFAKLYRFDEQLASRVCRYIELLPHVKGPKASARELIRLEGWQCFCLTTVFGWRRNDTGGRRFRRSYIEVPRGNAKSTLSSGVGLYGLTSDGEEGAEVYSAATTRDQAKIVWGDAHAMMRKAAAFRAHLGVVLNNYTIHHPRTNSKFEALTRESTTMDGKNLHIAIIDELHAHKDRGIYDVLETAMAKRFASLLWIITTAGTDTAGICYEVRSYVLKVLEGVAEDESTFGIVYTIDEADDWTDPRVWQKANPNWGVSVMPDMFAQLAQKAMQVLSAQNNFKTKHLNIWCNADTPWLDIRSWDRAGDATLKIEDFKDDPLYEAGDLATRTDITALARCFVRFLPVWVQGCADHERPGAIRCAKCYPPDSDNLEPHYFIFVKLFLPESAVADGRNSQYEGWALEGRLNETPGDVTDFGIVQDQIVADLGFYNLREYAYDPWQSAQMAQELQDEHGIVTVEFRATTQNFSPAMKDYEALMLTGRLHHDACPVMRWMISNVVCHRDAKDNVFPRKERPENKIDGPVASMMALSRALSEDDPYARGAGFKTL